MLNFVTSASVKMSTDVKLPGMDCKTSNGKRCGQ